MTKDNNIIYKEYYTTPEKLHKTLRKYGVAVLKGVLDNDELTEMKNGMWDTLNKLTKNFDKPIKKDDESTWRSFYDLLPLHSMLIQYYNLGHSQYAWDVRQNPKIAKIFADLWSKIDNKKYKEENMLTSFDGVSIHLPPETTNRGWYRDKKWFHTDQSYTRNDLECYQGMITGYDVNEGDATLSFIEASHKYHKKFAKKFNKTDKGDWYKLSELETEWYMKKCNKRIKKRLKKQANKNEEFDKNNVPSTNAHRAILAKAGDLIIWDSRTIHYGKEPNKNRPKKNFRCIVYVCQLPRSKIPKKDLEKVLKKKQKALEEMRVTSHWPDKVKMFPKNPRSYGRPLPKVAELKKPKLSKLGKKLAGLT